MKFVLSDSSLNSYGFRVLTSGLDIKDFKNNPIMFYNHDRSLLPIGKWTNISIKGDQLTAEPQFFKGEDAFVNKIIGLVEQGIINTTSIGLVPLEFSDSPNMLIPGQVRSTVTKAKVKEASFADIPSNANALRMFTEVKGELISLSLNEEGLHKILPIIKKVSNMELLDGLKEKLNLSESTLSEAEVLQRVEEIVSENEKYKVIELREIVEDAVSKRKITAADRQFYLDMGKKDIVQLKGILSRMPVYRSIESRLVSEETNTADRSKWTLNDYRKYAPLELRNNPKLYEQLIAKENHQQGSL